MIGLLDKDDSSLEHKPLNLPFMLCEACNEHFRSFESVLRVGQIFPEFSLLLFDFNWKCMTSLECLGVVHNSHDTC